jgi:glycosyltransferase involved in cell wall biosynthesis
MKILHINHSDLGGGAGRAAYRLHNSLKEFNIESNMIVNSMHLNNNNIQGPKSNLEKYINRLKFLASSLFVKTLITKNPIIHSPSVFPSNWIKTINLSDADILHLHWFQHETLSISDINKIKKPIVWTLHDMWGFCGAEHLSWDLRWRDGYLKKNRPKHERGFDLNRWTWERKKKYWKKKIQIVAPSNWLAGFVKESALMYNWPVTVIHNPINTNFWNPLDKLKSRKTLKLPLYTPLLLFGSMYGSKDFHKGFDLLVSSLKILNNNEYTKNLELVIFGNNNHKFQSNINFPSHYKGYINNDETLRLLYSACDALVIPSRQDNLPNNGIEAHACGTPVVGFNIGGLSDIVSHLQTGYLAKAFDVNDLAKGIVWTLNNKNIFLISKNARDQALKKFSTSKATKQYKSLYKKVLSHEKFKKKIDLEQKI